MKANNMLKIGFFAAAFALLSASLWAQPNYVEFSAAGTPESIDTVTIGSRMPYKMDGDPAVQKLVSQSKLAPSEFKWVFKPVLTSNPDLTVLNIGGTNNATAAGSSTDDYFMDKEISVKMTALGAYKLTINEQMMLTATKPGCPGTDSVANILVVDKPKLAWTTKVEDALCDPEDINVPLDLTGFGLWEVSYTISYIAHGATGSPSVIKTITNTQVGKNSSKAGSYDLKVLGTDINNGQADKSGVYTITITNLTDRISRKSLDPIAAVAGTDIPNATSVYTINVYPAPKTKKLQHVRNMP